MKALIESFKNAVENCGRRWVKICVADKCYDNKEIFEILITEIERLEKKLDLEKKCVNRQNCPKEKK